MRTHEQQANQGSISIENPQATSSSNYSGGGATDQPQRQLTMTWAIRPGRELHQAEVRATSYLNLNPQGSKQNTLPVLFNLQLLSSLPLLLHPTTTTATNFASQTHTGAIVDSASSAHHFELVVIELPPLTPPKGHKSKQNKSSQLKAIATRP